METKVINHSPITAAKVRPNTFKPDQITCGICKHSCTEGELHCRRYPPTVFFNIHNGPEVLFPGVMPEWFCGEGKS